MCVMYTINKINTFGKIIYQIDVGAGLEFIFNFSYTIKRIILTLDNAVKKTPKPGLILIEICE